MSGTWCWPVYPFEHYPVIHINRWEDWRPDEFWRRGKEFPVQCGEDEILYYRPRRVHVSFAECLFPGQGERPPWERVYQLLSRKMDSERIKTLRCYDALALVDEMVKNGEAPDLAGEIEKAIFFGRPPSQTEEVAPHVKIQASTVAVHAASATLNASTVSAQAAPVADSKAPAESGSATSEAHKKAKRKQPKWWWKKAVELLKTDPGKSDHAIAKAIGISPSTISRDDEFQRLADGIRRMSAGEIRQGVVDYDQEEYRHVDGVIEAEDI